MTIVLATAWDLGIVGNGKGRSPLLKTIAFYPSKKGRKPCAPTGAIAFHDNCVGNGMGFGNRWQRHGIWEFVGNGMGRSPLLKTIAFPINIAFLY
jgi:hypothetical protein